MPTPEELAAAAAAGGAKPWHETAGFDADSIGYLQNRGLTQQPDMKSALTTTIKAHQEAQRALTVATGADAKDLVKVPRDDAAPEVKKAFWERLGAPKDAKDYDFTSVKRQGDKALDQQTTDFLRNLAGGNMLPKEVALNLAKSYAKMQDSIDQQNAASKAATIATEKAALQANWTSNYDANLFVAHQTALKFGFNETQIKAMEGAAGFASVMEIFRAIGMATGEGRYLATENGGNGNAAIMTKEGAEVARKELLASPDFNKRLTNGDPEAKKQMAALVAIITGVKLPAAA